MFNQDNVSIVEFGEGGKACSGHGGDMLSHVKSNGTPGLQIMYISTHSTFYRQTFLDRKIPKHSLIISNQLNIICSNITGGFQFFFLLPSFSLCLPQPSFSAYFLSSYPPPPRPPFSWPPGPRPPPPAHPLSRLRCQQRFGYHGQ